MEKKMSDKFKLPKNTIEKAMSLLKRRYAVHKDANFNDFAEDNLRKEVTFRDIDFQEVLKDTEAATFFINSALDFLKEKKIIPDETSFDFDACIKFNEEIETIFDGPWSSLSHSMKYLIYMLTSIKQPKDLLEFGSFWGYTLAWFAGPYLGENKKYNANRIIGIDIDKKMCNLAINNFSKLINSEKVEIINEDARNAIKNLDGNFDFLYLEAKAKDIPGLYLILLKQVYDKLPKGAWVIAHDTTALQFQKENEEYLEWVRNKKNFSESISFDIDRYGLELSIK